MNIEKRVLTLLLALLAVILIGTTGYYLVEGWSVLESLYMVVITISTVGFMEVRELSAAGRIFTMFLILGGTGVLVYAASTVVSFVVEGELTGMLGRRKMEKQIAKLKGHYIVCGVGATGRYAIEELKDTKTQFVVVELDIEKMKKPKGLEDVLYVEGDATDDEILKQAGVERAAGLITALPTDEENLFVTLTAKGLNRDLRIVSKAIEESTERKLRRAGANAVVSPSYIGGLRMVSEMIRPTVTSFLDIMLREGQGLRITESIVGKKSKLVGHTLDELEIHKKIGAMVLAIKDVETGKYIFNPGADTMLKEGDILILLADINQMETLKNLIG